MLYFSYSKVGKNTKSSRDAAFADFSNIIY